MDAIANQHETGSVAAVSTLKILLVDDSKSIRESIRSLLEHAGHQITLADDGFDALCKIPGLRPDIVFMDIVMPGLDGLQACSLIKASKFGETPVVLVSANDGLLDRARAELAGAARYIPKPFRKADLLTAISTLVRKEGNADGANTSD